MDISRFLNLVSIGELFSYCENLWKTMTVLLLYLKTYENNWFCDVEEWKTMTVLICCLKTYENHWFWEVEDWKTKTAFCLLFENL